MSEPHSGITHGTICRPCRRYTRKSASRRHGRRISPCLHDSHPAGSGEAQEQPHL